MCPVISEGVTQQNTLSSLWPTDSVSYYRLVLPGTRCPGNDDSLRVHVTGKPYKSFIKDFSNKFIENLTFKTEYK